MFDFKNNKSEPGYKGNLNLEHTKSRNTFIGRNGPKLPNNFRYDQENNRNKMKSISDSNRPKEEYPDRIGEVKSETGKIEIGYDGKKKEAVITARDWSLNPSDNVVNEAISTEKRDKNKNKFRSNDDKFEKSAVSFRLKSIKNFPMGKLKKISSVNDYKSIVDKSEPFVQTKFNDKRIKQLKDMRSKTDGNKAEIDKEISKQQKIKEEKKLKNRQFKSKLSLAMDDVRTRSLMTFSEYIIYIKKRVEQIQSTSDDDNNNKNNNNTNTEKTDNNILEQELKDISSQNDNTEKQTE